MSDKTRKIKVPVGNGEYCTLQIGIRLVTGRTVADVETNMGNMAPFGYTQTGLIEETINGAIGKMYCIFDADTPRHIFAAQAVIKHAGGVHRFNTNGMLSDKKAEK